ncbi:hypothetical protein OHA45_12155 [Streptomyces lydicus]|uniref:hypothetical protein n=1 Tax=Streptomyces lydicus TaxID=47763 RepID=UPI002E360A47|nr:hypothetical protein [Streptomyces lydicus]
MSIWSSQNLGFAAAALSAVAAVGSWIAARRANSTAATVARIERARWRDDLTPRFVLSLRDLGGGRFNLHVHLDGPDSLGDLDAVSMEVVNDDMDHRVLNPGFGLTQEEADAHIWGPFRFTPGVDGADERGRSVPSVALMMGRGRPFAMERTRPGHWMVGQVAEGWQQRYVGMPIRLRLTCSRGQDTWILARKVENPPL